MIKLVLAIDEAGGIGKDNTMPWPHCSADLKRFKALTVGHVVVMGSNTWNSKGMPNPLPNRINYVLSNSMQEAPGATIVNGDAEEVVTRIAMDHIHLITWVIGGVNLIEQCWDIIDEYYITRIPGNYNCDTKIDLNRLKKKKLLQSTIGPDVTFERYK
jgi:dihydrofolate reductase